MLHFWWYCLLFWIAACGCKGINKVCDPVTGDCVCPPNSQGRVCDPCQCNGNSNLCRKDGTCFNCGFNTVGRNCEKCKESYYGNALRSDCKGRSYHFCVSPNRAHCTCFIWLIFLWIIRKLRIFKHLKSSINERPN